MSAANAATLASRMDTFTNPDGTNYFALSIKPEGIASVSGPRDVLVMFNTSASQTGEYRAKALEALQGLMAGLSAGDRVQLMAVDLNATPLTKTFVDPKSKELSDAMGKLNARVPLGATDMKKAMTAAAGSFAADVKNPKSVIYIGDGRSTAKFMTAKESNELVNKLVDNRISVDSYLIGARTDQQIVAALAGQTGGVIIADVPEMTAQQAAANLKSAVESPVLWPQAVAWPQELTEVFPKHTPPLRTDRDTTVIGTFKGASPFEIQYAVDTPAGQEKLSSSVKPSASDDVNNYLIQVVEYARKSEGATVPLVGSASLEQLRVAVNLGSMNIRALARQALSSGDLDGAEKLIAEALRQDPNDAETIVLKNSLEKARKGEALPAGAPAPVAVQPAAGGEGDLNLVGPAAMINDKEAGAMAEGFQQERKIITQVIQAEVLNTINHARSQMSIDPDSASQNLKMMLEKVRQAADINPDVRDQLSDQLRTALRESARRKVEFEFRRQQQQETMAAARERQMVTENLVHDQQKVKQLMDRFNSLMNEGKYVMAEETAAAEALKIMPDSPVALSAKINARVTEYFTSAMALREQRQKAVVDTLYQVEKSFIPFPDDPPIVYPDADVWQQLTVRRKDKYSSMDLAKPNSAEKKINEALKSPTVMEFVETPLEQVITFLKDYHKIEIQLDKKALEDGSVTTDTPITINIKNISLKSGLRLMLRNLNLTYMIRDEVLFITTQEEADARLVTKVYPVADLVIPVTSNMMGGMGMGMMGGGMMGGMGGGMGGMGGGMGGMGGGMGGMGGGMGGMGGGMFNVPRELLPANHPLNLQRDMLQNMPQGGFQAFSVKDDLRVPASVTASADVATSAKTENSALATQKIEKIQTEIPSGVKPEQYWDKYFSTNTPDQAAVRDAVRRLMTDRKYASVIALIGSALRQRQAQPWMYEAMSLAMQAAGSPKEEIERAVMSAVDFCDNPGDMMFIGTYLMQLGLNERALDIFHQVAQQDPVRPEPYMLGLKAARELNDLDGLRWASLGILNQAWTKDQEKVWEAGVGVAKETIERLKKEKRDKEADKFLAELNQAVARDCVVAVHWTGEADVDLQVLEPSGAVCSLRNPRTTAGGVMLGDVLSQTNSDNSGGHSAVYVCPKGFDGTYRLKVWRVWGKVTTGKVTVEVITHFRDKNTVTISKKLPLEKDVAGVTFDLTDGRRKESLREQQVTVAANTQLAVSQQVLAQQIASSVNPTTLGSLAVDRTSSASGGNIVRGGNVNVNGNGLVPFAAARGAVGYQPVIQTLTAGAMLSATAVVSADRRYVRFSGSPFFSGIGNVFTYNTSSGATNNTTNSGGGNSGGFSSQFGGGGGTQGTSGGGIQGGGSF